MEMPPTSQDSAPAANMLWGGRFTSGLDPLMVAYNESLPYDRIFYVQDIAGSVAWARANKNVGIISEEEFAQIEEGLAKVKREWASDTFEPKPADEDIHTANERRLGEIIGKDVAGKLHTGRSRNEQVATDMRLWLRDELRKMDRYLSDLLKATISRANAEVDFLVSSLASPPD